MLPFLEDIQPELVQVNKTIEAKLYSDEPLVEDIAYHLINAGGKRLRPILVLLCAKAFGYSGKHHLELAAIIEFIHTATLLHDDVVDVSALRRGLPTANAQWGNAPSVLVGDFLYSRAFQMMVDIGNMQIMQILSNTTNVIAEGEVQQLANAKNPNITEQEYLKVIYKKTAALFEAACECGATIAGANKLHRQNLKLFGHHLGLAFQLMDDLLDYNGSSADLGKNPGDDLSDGKTTLPLIYAIKHSSDEEARTLRDSISAPGSHDFSTIADILARTGGFSYTQEKAQRHAQTAIDHLTDLPESKWRQSMIALTRFSVERSH